MTLRFLLVCEGSSDTALIPHIRRLLVQYGQTDPEGNYWTRGNLLAEKIQEELQHSGDCDLLLLHRDAGAYQETRDAGPERRYDEIRRAVSEAGYTGAWVGIVPVQMTEAWLLLDEPAIRKVAGRPHSNAPLGLPPPNQVESDSDPTGRLAEALIVASGASGRRLRRFERDLPQIHRQLLEGLPPGGLLEQVPSWVRFRDELETELNTLQNDL